MFLPSPLDTLVPEEKSAAKERSGKANRPRRKDFSCYMLLRGDNTKGMVGHLADISIGGFKLYTWTPMPLNQEFRLSTDLGIFNRMMEK